MVIHNGTPLPPLKNFVKALVKKGYNCTHLQQRFTHIIEAKLRQEFIMD